MEEAVKGSIRAMVMDAFPRPEADIRTYSPLALAFVGDSVYSLIIRSMVIAKGNRQAEKLHNETKKYVSAAAQARIADALRDLLTEEEEKVYKRGCNANPPHHAKNATLEEYLKATGLEALCGYLYLQDRTDRFITLLKEGIDRAEKG